MTATKHRSSNQQKSAPRRTRLLRARSHKWIIPFIVLLPLLLLVLLATTACGSEEPQKPGVRLKSDAISSKTAIMAGNLGSRVGRLVVTVPAKKYQSSLQVQQRIGSIEIPRVGIREWVIQGTSTAELKLGAGHIEGTSIPGLGGNFAIAGDRVLYSAPFLRLDQLEVGDDLLVHMPYGDFTYQVEARTNVAETEVSVLKPRGYDSVTLSTCDPPWQLDTRMIIFARLVDTEPGT